MSLQIIETGEVIEPMSRVEAERITARIADKLDGIADNLEQVMPLIREALTREAWKALGYTGPTAYVSERFSGSLGRLTPDVRRPIVGELSAAGMSTRAIAPIVGTGPTQVRNDLRQVRTECAPESPASPASPDPAPVIGMDGKTYRRPSVDRETGEVLDETPEPAKPRRSPLPEQFRDAIYDMSRKTEKVARLLKDDRFPQNTATIADHNRAFLRQTRDDLARILDALNITD